jgi:hypothetical protein
MAKLTASIGESDSPGNQTGCFEPKPGQPPFKSLARGEEMPERQVGVAGAGRRRAGQYRGLHTIWMVSGQYASVRSAEGKTYDISSERP